MAALSVMVTWPVMVWAGSVSVDQTDFAVELKSNGKIVALVDTTTGQTVSKKRLHSQSAQKTKLFVKDVREDNRYEALIIAKRKTSNVTVHVVAIKTTAAKLQLKDVVTVQQAHLVPGRTKVSRQYITLRNKLGEVIAKYKVKSNYQLTRSDEDLPTLVALGDDHYSTATPSVGEVYLCQKLGGTGGASQDGDWIQGDYWDYTAKNVTVDGAVSWDDADITITTNGEDRTITGNGLPNNHTTGEFPIATSDDAYDYDHNPNSIGEQSIALTLPANPTESSSPNCVGGQVGIALNGVAIFNGLDATNRDAVAHEIQDSYGGHPEITGLYHYHTISDAVAELAGSENSMTLLGYAYDGFGIYGETEFSKTLRTADLDKCHGHTHAITWDGETMELYHYHVTKDYPYTVGCFKGESAVD